MATSEQAVAPACDHAQHGAHVDSRPRWRRLAWPLGTAAGVLLATTYIRFVDPNQPGHYPICPTRFFLGLDCPACGGLRATHALANGDLAGAFDHNMLFVIAIPLLVAAWVLWVVRAWTGRRPDLTPRRAWLARVGPTALVIVVLIFGIVRNFVPYLGSGVG